MADGVNIFGERLMTEQDFRELCCEQMHESFGVIFAKLAGELGDPFRFDPGQVEQVRAIVARELAQLLGEGKVMPVSTLYRGHEQTIPVDLARERLRRDGFRAFLNHNLAAHRRAADLESEHAS